MSGSFFRMIIDFVVKHTPESVRRNILRTCLYAVNSIRSTPGSYTYEVHQRMQMSNILPVNDEVETDNEVTMEGLSKESGKIKIRIVYPSGTAWNCIGTVYEELIKDDRYQTVIITENYVPYINIMKEKKCSFIRLDRYDVKVDRPDILILTSYSSTPPTLNFKGVKKYAGTILSLFPNVIINEFSIEKHWRYVRKAYEFCDPDYYLMDSLPYNYCDGYIERKKAVHMGNPQFDELFFRLENTVSDDPTWDKLNGKKVFLWATDHGLNEYYPIDALSIDLYIGFLFKFFAEHPELGLIIRPHPFLIREMKQSALFWNETDFERIISYCKNSANIVWDDTADYCAAFKRCDAMLVDANCGFTISFLATGKPVCRLLRGDMDVRLIHPELRGCYYYGRSSEEIKEFIQNVTDGRDPLCLSRLETFHSSVMHFDGCNGRRIKVFIDRIAQMRRN